MIKIKTRDLKGETLNYAVGMALEENISESMGNPDRPFKSPKVFYTRGDWDRSYRFNPSDNAALFARLKIPIYGQTNLPDACRVFVEDILGREVQIPDSFAHYGQWPEQEKQGADASKFTRPASEQAVWDGEGLPPAGVECEFAFIGNYRESFSRGKVIAYGPLEVIMQHWASGNEFIQPLDKITFRPIRTESERVREEAIQFMSCKFRELAGEVSGQEAVFSAVYDAIAAGKIPGVKLEE